MYSESTPTPHGDMVDKWLRELSRKKDPHFRLGQIANKNYIEGLSSTTEFKDHTTAWIIHRTMIEKQIDEGAKMDQDSRTWLGTLISVFR